MLEPEEVSAMLWRNELGWGARRIARELGVSRNTVKDYIAADCWRPYQQPGRKKALDGLEEWLRERLRRHRGNAGVIRQQLVAEKGSIVSLRTVERTVKTRNHCLRERHSMVTLHLHPLAGHNPHAVSKIELAPSRAQRFLATDACQDHEFECPIFNVIAKGRHQRWDALCSRGRPGLPLGDLLGKQSREAAPRSPGSAPLASRSRWSQ
jgi:transposase